MSKKLGWSALCRPRRSPRTNTKTYVSLIIVDWNAKVGSQDISGTTDKFGLGEPNEVGQKLTEIC